MGGSISALITNTFGELKGEEEAEEEMLRAKQKKKKLQKPGQIRIGMRRLRDFVVFGRGKQLLPQDQDDQFFDSNAKEKQEEDLKSIKVSFSDILQNTNSLVSLTLTNTKNRSMALVEVEEGLQHQRDHTVRRRT